MYPQGTLTKHHGEWFALKLYFFHLLGFGEATGDVPFVFRCVVDLAAIFETPRVVSKSISVNSK